MKRRLFNTITLCLLLITTVLPCSQKPLSKLQKQLGIQIHNHKMIRGQTSIKNHLMNYEILDKGDAQFLKFEIDEYMLEALVSYDDLRIELDGHNAKLTESQKNALMYWSEHFAYTLATRSDDEKIFSFTLLENTILMLSEYWSQAPQNYIYPTKNADTESLRRDGLTCVKKGKRYAIEYDDRHGNILPPYDRKAGGPKCKGRCGRSCADNWWQRLTEAWGLDCLEHDTCIDNIDGGDLGADPDCGDEFWHTVDDFLFGRVIGRCNGNRD